MARVGIDLGTTNTVVALADRGNYPVLALSPPGHEGARPGLPMLFAWRDGEVRVGGDALAVWDEPGWVLIGSPKRALGRPVPDLPPGLPLDIEGVMSAFFAAVHDALRHSSHIGPDEEIEALVGVPANASSLQRLRTLEAARRAGFKVLGLLHEPTAAAIEYAHRNPAPAKGRGKPRHLLVYDLGGGTFDVAVVRADPEGMRVLCSAGVERLGGDDFDQAMAELALEPLGLTLGDLSWNARERLLLRCREAKEALRPSARRWLIDFSGLDGFEEDAGEVMVSAADYAARCQPLIERTVSVLAGVLERSGLGLDDLDALLLCGGGSQLGLVQKRIKELCGTRLKVSPHPFAATAIGLAIHAERHEERPARQPLARYFGVWREAEGGARRVFDPIFTPEDSLPPPGDLLLVRRAYHPAHDLGHYRFAECAAYSAREQAPDGENTAWCEVRFPYDPTLDGEDEEALAQYPVRRTDRFAGLVVEERYECDSQGIITVRLRRATPALSRSYLLYGPERVPPIPART